MATSTTTTNTTSPAVITSKFVLEAACAEIRRSAVSPDNPHYAEALCFFAREIAEQLPETMPAETVDGLEQVAAIRKRANCSDWYEYSLKGAPLAYPEDIYAACYAPDRAEYEASCAKVDSESYGKAFQLQGTLLASAALYLIVAIDAAARAACSWPERSRRVMRQLVKGDTVFTVLFIRSHVTHKGARVDHYRILSVGGNAQIVDWTLHAGPALGFRTDEAGLIMHREGTAFRREVANRLSTLTGRPAEEIQVKTVV